MKLRSILVGPTALVAAGLFLSGCGAASQVAGTAQVSAAAALASPSAATAVVAAPAAAAKSAAGAAPAGIAEAGALGTVLVGENGNTLYAFTKDVDGVSTCFDACAKAWPPVIVTDGFTEPEGVDPALVSTVDRPDGTKQLKIGKWPLYFFAGDAVPGDTNGQGSGDVWFVESADGTLIKGDTAEAPAAEAAPATTAPATEPAPAAEPDTAADPAPVAEPAPAAATGPVVDLAQVGNLGEVMVGANGHTLYAFTNDPEKQSTCFDACATAWPPLIVGDDFTITDELQAAGASTIDRPDGTKQLAMGKWALYYYAGDAAPGDANGQGSGDKWFAIDATCKLVKTTA